MFKQMGAGGVGGVKGFWTMSKNCTFLSEWLPLLEPVDASDTEKSDLSENRSLSKCDKALPAIRSTKNHHKPWLGWPLISDDEVAKDFGWRWSLVLASICYDVVDLFVIQGCFALFKLRFGKCWGGFYSTPSTEDRNFLNVICLKK